MNSCGFHRETQIYLSRFYEILGGMIRDMEGAELTDSISQKWIIQRIPHHRAGLKCPETSRAMRPQHMARAQRTGAQGMRRLSHKTILLRACFITSA